MRKKILSAVLSLLIAFSVVSIAGCDKNPVKEDPVLTAVSISKAPSKTSYIAGESFDTAGMEVTASYDDKTSKAVTSYTYSPNGALAESDKKIVVSYTENGVTKTANMSIFVTAPAAALASIAVTKAADKTDYYAGDIFDPAGMTVTATYTDSATKNVTSSCSFTTDPLTLETTEVTVTYTENGVTKTAAFPVTVTAATRALTAITVDAAAAKTVYRVNDLVNTKGLVVKAYYDDDTDAVVTNFTASPQRIAQTDTRITVSYSEAGVTKTKTYNITVKEEGINLAKNIADTDEWVDANFADSPDSGNPNRGIYVFELSTEENSLSTIKTLEKFDQYNALIKNVGMHDFSAYKRLSIIASAAYMTTMIVKLETIPEIPGGSGYSEINLPLSSAPETFIFDISFESYARVRTGIKRVVIMPNSLQTGEDLPDIYVEEMVFTHEEITDAEKPLVYNIEAPNIPTPNEYDGVSSTFDVNKNFVDHDNNFTIAWSIGSTLITVKEPGKLEWAYINSPVVGNIKSMTKIHIKYRGTAGTSFKLKLEGPTAGVVAYETTHEPLIYPDLMPDPTCNGEIQDFIWTGFGPANLSGGGQMMVLIFYMPGIAGGAGNQLEIFKYEFQK